MNYLLDDLMDFEKTAGDLEDAIAEAKQSGSKLKDLYRQQGETKKKVTVLDKRRDINSENYGRVLQLKNKENNLSYAKSKFALSTKREDFEYANKLWNQNQRELNKYISDNYDVVQKGERYAKLYRNADKLYVRAKNQLQTGEEDFASALEETKKKSEAVKRIRATQSNKTPHEVSPSLNRTELNQNKLNYASGEQVAPKKAINGKLMAGVGLGAATIGGLYAYNRYKKKKRTQAEQEKTAARQFKDFEDFKNSMPKDKKKAANLKFSPDDFEWGEYDAGLGYNFEDARRWHYDNYKATPKEKESINNLYRSMNEDHQNFTKQQAAAKGLYEKALSRGKTMRRVGLGVSAGGAGLALLAGSGKLPENLKVPVAAAGAIATIGGLKVRRKGRSLTKKEREKYNQLEIDYGKRREEKINSPAFKNYWDGVHDHWGDWGQWDGPTLK